MVAKENLGEVFPGLRKCVFASSFPLETTEETKENTFQKLVQILLDKRVFTTTGKFFDSRENCFDYLLDVIPRLEEDEIQLIFLDPNSFYKKFCFSPSMNTCSLFSRIKRMGLKDRFNDIPIDELFDRYYAEMGLSPYELVEDRAVVDSFLEEVEAEEPAMALFGFSDEFE